MYRIILSSIGLWFMAFCVAGAGEEQKTLSANSIGMKLALIPAGQFMMGSPADEKGRESDETQHRVTLSRDFRMSTTEVTQGQWAKVMGQKRNPQAADEEPVTEVSWKDALAFCQKLSKKESKTYRLPTEAEWEYACRAGSVGRFSGSDKLEDLAWYDDNSDGQAHPVTGKKANAFGLYDMHGNVAEWCADYYVAAYPVGSVTDPTGPDKGKGRVVRGGSWSSFVRGCRAASRGGISESYQLKTVGFRVILEDNPG